MGTSRHRTPYPGARLVRSGPLEAAPEAVLRRRQENKKAEKKFQGGMLNFLIGRWLSG
jgi:hypothetical protein